VAFASEACGKAAAITEANGRITTLEVRGLAPLCYRARDPAERWS